MNQNPKEKDEVVIEPYEGPLGIDPALFEQQAQLRAANRVARLARTPEQISEWVRNLKLPAPPTDQTRKE